MEAKLKRYLTAQEVAEALGISVATVYAYVSRGLLRSEAAGGSTRNRRYYGEDVERLKARQAQRQHPEKVTETALHWGAPLLESGLTLIADGRPFYRGVDALELAQSEAIEAVAALLWTGDLDAEITGLRNALMSLPPRCQAMASQLGGASAFERFQVLLPLAALDDLAAYDLRPASVMQAGARILRLLAAIAADRPVGEESIASLLQQAWRPDDARAAYLLNMALVLCADHELNVSAFTARCVASASSTPYAAVIAGMAALQGTKHGGNTEQVTALFREIGTPGNVQQALVSRIKRGEYMPGFGHPLYADGDLRGRLLLDTVMNHHPESDAVQLAAAIEAQVMQLTGQPPNIDFALVVLAQTLQLPAGAPLTLFALGRTVGWIGHILEQYESDHLIRPRARYMGPQPPV